MSTAEHLKSIDGRLDRIETKIGERFAAVDAHFVESDGRLAGIDRRLIDVDRCFDGVDRRFDDVDGRLDEQRSEFRALFEASRSDFNNLYGFVKAQAERTDARFDQAQAEIRTRFADVQTAIMALASRGRRIGGRRRR